MQPLTYTFTALSHSLPHLTLWLWTWVPTLLVLIPSQLPCPSLTLLIHPKVGTTAFKHLPTVFLHLL